MKLLLKQQDENSKVFLLGRTNHNQFLATFLNTQEDLENLNLANFFKFQSISILAI